MGLTAPYQREENTNGMPDDPDNTCEAIDMSIKVISDDMAEKLHLITELRYTYSKEVISHDLRQQ